MDTDRMDLALVGCGVIFRHHLDAIAASPSPRRIRVTALVEPDASRRASAVAAVHQKLGERPQPFASLAEALAADPGLFCAVDIMVPSLGTLHEQLTVEALRGGKHVLLEKPIALSIGSAERILAEAARWPDLRLLVAENSQYWHEVVAVQTLIAQGAIGDVLCARAKFWESGHPLLNEWAADGSYDPGSFTCEGPEGFVFDGGLHWLRPLMMWLGPVERVSALAGKTIAHMKGPGLTQALLQFESGVSAVFEAVLAPGAISNQPFFVVQGSKGEIVVDGFEGGARLYTLGQSGLEEADLNSGCEQFGWDTGYRGELDDFASVVLDGGQPKAGPEAALRDLSVMLAIMLAAKSKEWQAVADVPKDLEMQTLGLTL